MARAGYSLTRQNRHPQVACFTGLQPDRPASANATEGGFESLRLAGQQRSSARRRVRAESTTAPPRALSNAAARCRSRCGQARRVVTASSSPALASACRWGPELGNLLPPLAHHHIGRCRLDTRRRLAP